MRVCQVPPVAPAGPQGPEEAVYTSPSAPRPAAGTQPKPFVPPPARNQSRTFRHGSSYWEGIYDWADPRARRCDTGILRDFEKRLESVFEGFFARALPGGGVQPVELGKAMVRKMDELKTVSIASVYVPNAFSFHLSSKDFERLAPLEQSLARELATIARRAAASEGWRLPGPPEIHFAGDGRGPAGTFDVEAHVVEAADEQEEAGPHTQLIEMSLEADAELVLVGQNKRTYPLSKDVVAIGRLDACDVALADPGVSRRHAEVHREGDEWVVVDSGSTNGTIVNGKRVNRHRLKKGDRITVGDTVLEFRRP